jgi:hypothetical protein
LAPLDDDAETLELEELEEEEDHEADEEDEDDETEPEPVKISFCAPSGNPHFWLYPGTFSPPA